MQFSAIALSATAFFSASLAAKLQMRAGDCSTDSVKCCNQVKDASSIDTGTLGLLGIDELAGQVGLECDQIAAVVGVPISNQCKTTAACCSDQTQNGLANLLYKSVKASLRRRRSYNVNPPKSIAVILIMNESSGLWRRNKQLQWLIDSARNATSWCEKMGVQQLMIYESTGTLKKYYSDIQDDDLVADTPPLSPPPTPKIAPRRLNKGISVRVLSGDEASDRFFTVAEDVHREEFETHTQRIAFTDSLMKRWYKHDDPELIVVHHLQPSFISRSLQMNGFPPWQLRVGEIYHDAFRLPFSRGPLKQYTLTKALYAYGKVEQRLGR
ncbi:hypothetical protein E3P92_02853 [Wallemia ichthyophaga]|nr:hypothetical protein E3P91_03997 [Wallemia ichthyophaga]TIB01325.1 hypothetical protein E3P96_02418 [Wallemia ichthyophaga]TIB11673.1 hypothetical protein E3P92_02853 [Wallemia ichthyophaga]TIB61635.1 hypothetical protein E3P78_02751 [Wallemia ichthyophaga]